MLEPRGPSAGQTINPPLVSRAGMWMAQKHGLRGDLIDIPGADTFADRAPEASERSGGRSRGGQA